MKKCDMCGKKKDVRPVKNWGMLCLSCYEKIGAAIRRDNPKRMKDKNLI